MNKGKLAVMQKQLLEKGNSKDYHIIETILKGNYLLKSNWRRDLQQGDKREWPNSGANTPAGSIRQNTL